MYKRQAYVKCGQFGVPEQMRFCDQYNAKRSVTNTKQISRTHTLANDVKLNDNNHTWQVVQPPALVAAQEGQAQAGKKSTDLKPRVVAGSGWAVVGDAPADHKWADASSQSQPAYVANPKPVYVPNTPPPVKLSTVEEAASEVGLSLIHI